MNKELERKYKIIEKEPKRSINALAASYRSAARFFAKVLIRTSITPNQVTIFAALLGIIAASLFLIPNYWVTIAATLLLHLRLVLDQTDGALARANDQCSELGDWMDGILDRVCDVFLFFFLSLGNYLATGNSNVWIFGFIAMTGTMLNTAFIPITKTTYPKIEGDIRLEVKKRSFLGNFVYTRMSVRLLLTFFALIGNMYWSLIAISIYSYLFYLISLFYFARKFRKMGPTNTQGRGVFR